MTAEAIPIPESNTKIHGHLVFFKRNSKVSRRKMNLRKKQEITKFTSQQLIVIILNCRFYERFEILMHNLKKSSTAFTY